MGVLNVVTKKLDSYWRNIAFSSAFALALGLVGFVFGKDFGNLSLVIGSALAVIIIFAATLFNRKREK